MSNYCCNVGDRVSVCHWCAIGGYTSLEDSTDFIAVISKIKATVRCTNEIV